MTYLDIDKALCDITVEKNNECKNRLDAVPKENKGERKALQIELGMYSLCLRAGLLYYTYGTRENALKIRRQVIDRILPAYPQTNEIFTGLSEDEQMIMHAALQAEIFMRDQFMQQYRAELEQAKAASDSEKIFELEIKIGAIENVFSAWEEWRVQNNIYPHMFKGKKK